MIFLVIDKKKNQAKEQKILFKYDYTNENCECFRELIAKFMYKKIL